MRDRLRRVALLGLTPPVTGAGRDARLAFVRDYQIRWFMVGVIGEIIAVVVGVGMTTVVFPVLGTAVLALDIAWLSVKIRRTQ